MSEYCIYSKKKHIPTEIKSIIEKYLMELCGNWSLRVNFKPFEDVAYSDITFN